MKSEVGHGVCLLLNLNTIHAAIGAKAFLLVDKCGQFIS